MIPLSIGMMSIEKLFPFCVVIDKDGTIMRMGTSLKKLIGHSLGTATKISSHFQFVRPGHQNFDNSISRLEGEMIVLREIAHDAKFMGQLITLPESKGYLLVINLVVQDAEELARLNLTFNDFAVQDQVFDFLMLVQSHRQATQHAESLNKKLAEAHKIAVKASDLKSQFLANMSHELRTPMNGVIGMASVLADTELTGEQKEYVDGIMTSGETMLALINDILDLSKIEAGHIKLEHSGFNLPEAMGDAFQMLKTSADKKHLSLKCEIQKGLTKQYFGDVHRLMQVVINLAANAIKFTENGFVAIQVMEDLALRKSHRSRLTFVVEDSGIGMSKETLNQIFQPFVQGDSSMTKKYEGTGLGLSISKRIIDLMDGTIHVKSAPGKGTTFSFQIGCDRLPTSESLIETVIHSNKESQ